MRSKNSFKTMVYGFILTFVIAILGLFKTKILLAYLGEDSLAIYQVFANIYTYLSIIDGGITSAMIFYLYRPIREKDNQKISEIVNGVKSYFNKVGFIIVIIGIIVSLNIMFFIKDTSLSSNYIKICCIIFIIANALSYFAAGYSVLYEAEQKTYKSSNLNHGLSIAKGIVEIILALIGLDLLSLMISFLVLSLLKNLILIYISRKDHKYLIKTEIKDITFTKETNNMFVYKITWLIFESIDVVLLSKFVGSVAVIIYTAYYQITHMITLMIKRINSAIIPGIGDMLMDEDYDHARNVFDEINSLLFYIGFVICIPLYFVLNPFIDLWYGEKYVTSSITTFLFVLVLFTSIIGIILEAFIKSSGHFKSIKKWAIYQGIVNLIISLSLVKKLGVMGVLIGTFIAFITGNFVSYPRIISKEVIKRDTKVYYKNCLIYMIVLIPSISICCLISNYLSYTNLIWWFVNGLLLFVLNFIIVTGYFYMTKNLKFIGRLKKVLRK